MSHKLWSRPSLLSNARFLSSVLPMHQAARVASNAASRRYIDETDDDAVDDNNVVERQLVCGTSPTLE